MPTAPLDEELLEDELVEVDVEDEDDEEVGLPVEVDEVDELVELVDEVVLPVEVEELDELEVPGAPPAPPPLALELDGLSPPTPPELEVEVELAFDPEAVLPKWTPELDDALLVLVPNELVFPLPPQAARMVPVKRTGRRRGVEARTRPP